MPAAYDLFFYWMAFRQADFELLSADSEVGGSGMINVEFDEQQQLQLLTQVLANLPPPPRPPSLSRSLRPRLPSSDVHEACLLVVCGVVFAALFWSHI